MSSASLYPLIGGQNLFMPGEASTGDTIFDSEENLEEEQEATGRQPLFSSPNDLVAGWMEQDREGNWYVSLQIHLPGLKTNVPLFVNDDREDARQYINKVGQALTN